MAHNAACKDTDVTPQEVEALLDLPHDLRGLRKEECLQVVRDDKLSRSSQADQTQEIPTEETPEGTMLLVEPSTGEGQEEKIPDDEMTEAGRLLLELLDKREKEKRSSQK